MVWMVRDGSGTGTIPLDFVFVSPLHMEEGWVSMTAAVLLLIGSSAQPAPPQQTTIAGVQVTVVASPAAAVAAAALDSVSLPDDVAPFTRYVWISDGDVLTAKAMSLVVNYTSHATLIVRPAPVAVGQVLLLRIDLRAYAPRFAELVDHLRLWEDYRNDPKFSLLITRDVLATLQFPDDKIPLVKVKRKVEKKVVKEGQEQQWRTEKKSIYHPGGDYTYPDDSGRVVPNCKAGQYSVELKFKVGEPAFEVIVVEEVVETKLTDVKDVDLVRLVGPQVDSFAYRKLCERLHTECPIVSHDYWMVRHLATVKGRGVYSEIYGGRYYEFMRFRRQGKGTDEDRILEDLGIGNIEAGVTAEKVFDRLRSDQRFALFTSRVTGKPRRGDVFRSLAGREGTGLVSITHDVLDEDIDVASHPIFNLIKAKDAGREGIAEGPNGLHRFWITDEVGKLQDAAPQALVEDSEIPAPYTRVLQPAIGCIRCHGIGKADGWKVAQNDVKAMLSKYPDVVSDAANRKATIPEVLDRLAGLYGGNPENKVFPRARDDYAQAVLLATGPWPASKGQTDVVTLASARISQVWADRNYKQVDALRALRELGIQVQDPKKAVAVLQALLPPAVENAAFGVVPEDPRVVAMLAGVSINRVDWDLVYGFVAARVARSLPTYQEKK